MNLRQSALIGILAIMIDAPLTSAKAWALEPETGLHWEGNSSVSDGEPLLQFAQVGYGKEPQTTQVSPTQVQPVPRLQPTQPQLPSGQASVSNEFLILQGVQRLEEKMTLLDSLLKGLNSKADALNQSQQQLSGRLQVLESWHTYPAAAARWEIALDGNAVLDRETNLLWEKSPSAQQLNWNEARFHCRNVAVGTRLGWRLPSIQELLSLSHSGPNFPFTGFSPARFWSETLGYQTEGHTEALIGLSNSSRTIFSAIGREIVTTNRAWCVRPR